MKTLTSVGKALLILSCLAAVAYGSRSAKAGQDDDWADELAQKTDEAAFISMEEQEHCTSRILDMVNKKFHARFTEKDVVPWAEDDGTVAMGYVRGGAFNIRIQSDQVSVDTFNRLEPGRSVSARNIFTLGTGHSLHVPGDALGVPVFHKDNIGGQLSVDFVAHIDSAMPYLPVGGLVHLFGDVIGHNSRKLCP